MASWFDDMATARGAVSAPAPTATATATATDENSSGLPPPPAGFDATKWYDLTHTSPKYVAGRLLAQGGSIQDAAAAIGATVIGDDKIRLADGSVIDVYFDFSGQGTGQVQWTPVGGGETSGDGGTSTAAATTPTVADTLPTTPGGTAPPGGAQDASWFDSQGIDATGGETAFGALAQPWQVGFDYDPKDVIGTPWYEFQLGEGQKAIERAAASKGTLNTGGTLKALARFGQGLASSAGEADYGRRLGEYRMAHDIFKGNQNDLFNRFASMAGFGQTGATQLGQSGFGPAGASAIQQGNPANWIYEQMRNRSTPWWQVLGQIF